MILTVVSQTLSATLPGQLSLHFLAVLSNFTLFYIIPDYFLTMGHYFRQ